VAQKQLYKYRIPDERIQNKFSNINPQDVEIEEDHGKGGMSEVGTGCRLNLEVKKKNKKTIFTRMSPVRT
jgi:hypothetical protein